MRILAVDDDVLVLEILRSLAARVEYTEVTTVLSAGTGLECSTAAQQQFQCIPLSIKLPVMDGIDLCDLLRRLPEYAESAIIMVTAVTERKFMNQAYAAGASEYVTKPFEVDDLTSRLGLAVGSLD